jgi:hypothetical protein
VNADGWILILHYSGARRAWRRRWRVRNSRTIVDAVGDLKTPTAERDSSSHSVFDLPSIFSRIVSSIPKPARQTLHHFSINFPHCVALRCEPFLAAFFRIFYMIYFSTQLRTHLLHDHELPLATTTSPRYPQSRTSLDDPTVKDDHSHFDCDLNVRHDHLALIISSRYISLPWG